MGKLNGWSLMYSYFLYPDRVSKEFLAQRKFPHHNNQFFNKTISNKIFPIIKLL